MLGKVQNWRSSQRAWVWALFSRIVHYALGRDRKFLLKINLISISHSTFKIFKFFFYSREAVHFVDVRFSTMIRKSTRKRLRTHTRSIPTWLTASTCWDNLCQAMIKLPPKRPKLTRPVKTTLPPVTVMRNS